MNIFRRLPLYRLLLLCGVALAVGIGATALAFALDSGPTPPARTLPDALHDALAGAQPEGFSANIQLTDHLLEGASLAGEGAGGQGGGGGLLSSPLVNGGSGRLWVAKDGRFRLELQTESGDTEIVYDGHTLELYDAASNTLYRYAPPKQEGGGGQGGTAEGQGHEEGAGGIPSVAKIEEAIAHVREHALLSEATPTDVGGQPAYTVSIAPKQSGSLLSSVQLSFDADNGVPLRAAVYSTATSSPVLELAASEVSLGAVESSVFELNPPANAKVHELKPTDHRSRRVGGWRLSAVESSGHGHHTRLRGALAGGAGTPPKLTLHGKGPGAIAVLEQKASGAHGEAQAQTGLPQVKVGNAKASELRTALGTILSFERAGVRYVLAGSVKPGALLSLASGL
jgi:outer membrane lipoprotein-sorting protein